MWAAKSGHASVVTLLLADGRVDPNMASQKGGTALMLAANEGHASVVTLLLANGRVDPNTVSYTHLTLPTTAWTPTWPTRRATRHSWMPLSKGTPRW